MIKKEVICACGCKRAKEVRVADINRGWGKYFSKSCKAKHQTQTHEYHVSTRSSGSRKSGKKSKVQRKKVNGYSHLSESEQRRRLGELFDAGRISYMYYLEQLPNKSNFEVSEYNDKVYHESLHPFSSEALGQE